MKFPQHPLNRATIHRDRLERLTRSILWIAPRASYVLLLLAFASLAMAAPKAMTEANAIRIGVEQ